MDDREPESGAAFHAVAIAAKETLEEVLLLFQRYARTIVFHHDFTNLAAVFISGLCHRERYARAFNT